METKINTKKSQEIDKKKLIQGLEFLIKDTDPMAKWEPVLNELKPQLLEAKSREVSLKKIHKVFKNHGANVPMDVLKKYVDLLV